MSYLFNNKIGFEDSAIDSFARLKVANPLTVFDSQHRYKDNEKWDTLTQNGGTAAHDSNESTIKMSVGNTAGAQVIRETRTVFPYQPGKSLLILNTFAMGSGKQHLTQRVGYYGNQNGVYFEQGGTSGVSLAFVLRSNTTGTTAETRVYQHEWNGDRFDGSGITGRTLDTTKGNILWTDVEWLGVGDVRCGFIVDGRPVVAHTFHHENVLPTTYMTTACLPIRYEIFNGATTDSPSTLRQICSSVISEGGYSGRSVRHNAGVGLTAAANMKTLSSAGVYYPVLSMRLQSARLDSVVIPTQIEIIAASKGIYHYKLLLNAALTAPSWQVHPSGVVEFDSAASGFSGGVEIGGGMFTELGIGGLQGTDNFNYQMGRSIGGTADTITLVVASQGQQQAVAALFGWEELV